MEDMVAAEENGSTLEQDDRVGEESKVRNALRVDRVVEEIEVGGSREVVDADARPEHFEGDIGESGRTRYD